jgi:hypothetical protein
MTSDVWQQWYRHIMRPWWPAVLIVLVAVVPFRAAAPLTLGVPGRANANVSMAAAGDVIAAAWSAALDSGLADVYAAVSRDGGTTFSTPVRVNSVAGDVRVNGEQPPRLALRERQGRAPEVAVIWTTKGASGTKLVTAISTDAGATFGPTSTVPGTDTVGNRGWEGLGAGPGGRFFSVWLDHRRLAQQEAQVAGEHRHGAAANGSTMASGSKTDGVAMAQLSQLYVAPIDGSIAPVAVTGGVCYCCKTAIAAAGQNALYVAWRHVYPGNLRDIAFSASRDGGRTFAPPVRVSEDKWQIEGCPDDGPSMAVDAAGRIHIVWPSVVTENGGPVKALFHAVSLDGQKFSARVRLPTEGQANHPQLTIDRAGRLLAIWDESGRGTRHLASAGGTPDGQGRVAFARSAGVSEVGTYPVVVPRARGALAAWTAGEPTRSLIKISAIN